MACKKSSFYHTRTKVRLNEQRAAEIIGVSVDDVKRFDDEGAPIPERLLLFWDSKNIGLDGWEGFLFSRGVLRWKNRRWTPSMLKNYHDQREELDQIKNELARLSTLSGLSTFFMDKVVDKIKKKQTRRGF